MKKALITGITGQDGSYLAELLLSKGYEVHGIIRRSSSDFRERISHLEGKPGFHLHYADMADSMSLVKVIGTVRPDEIYNLAAQSHVQVSFDVPEYTANGYNTNTTGKNNHKKTRELKTIIHFLHTLSQTYSPIIDFQIKILLDFSLIQYRITRSVSRSWIIFTFNR